MKENFSTVGENFSKKIFNWNSKPVLELKNTVDQIKHQWKSPPIVLNKQMKRISEIGNEVKKLLHKNTNLKNKKNEQIKGLATASKNSVSGSRDQNKETMG